MLNSVLTLLTTGLIGYLAGYVIARLHPDSVTLVFLFVVLFIGLNKFSRDFKKFLDDSIG